MHQRRNTNLFSLLRFCFLLCASTLCLQAQTVFRLRNGDRVTGQIISETTNQVTISTRWAKEFSLPLAEIESRETIPTVAPATNAPVVAKVATPPPAVVPVVAAPAKPVVKPKPPSAWHGDVQIGADVGISEARRELYYSRVKVTYAPVAESGPGAEHKLIDRFRNTFDYNAAYGTVTVEDANGKSDTKLSANRMDGSSKTDFDLGKERKVFAYNLLGAGYDEIRKIDRRYEIGPGMGWHAVTRSNFVMNTEIGMNYQLQYLHDETTTERFYYRLAQDLTWTLSKSLTFDEKLEVFPQLNLSEYRLRFESNLRYWLLANLSFNLTVLDVYDTQPANNVGRNDLQIRSSVGVKF